MEDGVQCIVNDTIAALKKVFSPDSVQPPIGGGTETVRFFAGEATPMSYVDMHISDCGCGGEPFIWVHLLRRYRSKVFPQPYVGDEGCGAPPAVAMEIGVARCAVMNAEGCSWDELAAEAEISLDDGWRIELAMCVAAGMMKADGCSDAVAIDSAMPYGPDGGVVAWTGTFFARVDSE